MTAKYRDFKKVGGGVNSPHLYSVVNVQKFGVTLQASNSAITFWKCLSFSTVCEPDSLRVAIVQTYIVCV